MISRNATVQCLKKLCKSQSFANKNKSQHFTLRSMRTSQINEESSRCFSIFAESQQNDYVSPFHDYFEMIQNNKIVDGRDADDYSELRGKKLRYGIPEDVLKFKTVSYGRTHFAPYVLPQEHKVTMQVNFDDIPLQNDLEKEIFFQIVGSRFDQSKNELTLTSSQFASRIENKRHAISMLERIIESAKFLASDVEKVQE